MLQRRLELSVLERLHCVEIETADLLFTYLNSTIVQRGGTLGTTWNMGGIGKWINKRDEFI